MADTKTTAVVKNAADIKREKIFIPRGAENGDPNLLVGINGVNYLLPRGEESDVPVFVAEAIRASWKAQNAADRRSAQLQSGKK